MTRAARCCAGSDSRSRRTDPVAKKALIAKAKRKPKFEVRALRAPTCGVPEVRAVPDLLPHHGPPRRTAWHHQIELVAIPAPEENLGARPPRARRPNWAPPAPTDHAEGPAGKP